MSCGKCVCGENREETSVKDQQSNLHQIGHRPQQVTEDEENLNDIQGGLDRQGD